jgi:predicted MFS family arabinose efflux permease
MKWDYKYSIVILALLANFTSGTSRLVISPVVELINSSFQITTSEIGFALTGMWLTFALLQYPAGILADRLGERRIILSAIGLICLSSFLVAQSPSFPFFVLSVLLLGAGSGTYLVAATAFLTKTFDNIGGALGVHSVGASIAGLAAPVAAAYLGTRWGWRYAILLGTVVAALTFGLLFFRIRPTAPSNPETTFRENFTLESFGLLVRPQLLLTTLVASMGYFTWQATASFFPTFLMSYAELSPTRASYAFGMIFVLSGIGKPAFGRVSDSIGRDAVLALCFVLATAGYAVLLITSDLFGLVAGVGLLGLGMGWGSTLQSRFMDHLSADERGTGFGLVNTVANVLGSLGSFVTGTLAAVFGWTTAVGVLATLLGACLLLIASNAAVARVKFGRGSTL